MTPEKSGAFYEVLNPWAEADPISRRGINPGLNDLAGKKIGLLRNSKRTAEPALKVVENRLKKRYPTASFSWFSNLKPNESAIAQDSKDDFEKWIEGVDTVIAAYGDWGSCTKYLVYDSVSIEERNKPTVSLVNQGFTNDAESAARSKGVPVLRYIPTKVPCESSIIADIEAGIDGVIDAIITALTRSLTPDEISPKSKEPETPERLIFKGNLEDVNRFFYQRGWTDGFPIIPPTESAVATMLSGTDLPPDHLLGKLQSRNGNATIEKIAINAVMAGCLPTYMPVLIACTINLLESEPGFGGYTTYGFSTGSWAPFWIINGPIRNEINVNNSSGAFSPGNITNATIGRAMGLIIKNIGGVRKGVEDMGTMGNPMKYTLVISENEEESPWEPLHVELGYKKEESTVTLSFPNCYCQHIPYTSDAQGILTSVVDSMPRGMRYNMVFTPTHARNLFREGYDKEKIKKYIVEHKVVPLARMQALGGIGSLAPQREAADLPGNAAGMVPLIKDPRFIRIIVGGGPGAFIAHLVGGGATPGKKQIQKIELPEKWAQLVKKYKNIVPTYAKY